MEGAVYFAYRVCVTAQNVYMLFVEVNLRRSD